MAKVISVHLRKRVVNAFVSVISADRHGSDHCAKRIDMLEPTLLFGLGDARTNMKDRRSDHDESGQTTRSATRCRFPNERLLCPLRNEPWSRKIPALVSPAVGGQGQDS